MKRLYLYLARRDKKGIKVITMIRGESLVKSRVTEIKSLDLPKVWKNKIEKVIYENRMLYEPWLESAASYEDLKVRLKSRGYSNLPLGGVMMFNLGGDRKSPIADTSSCKVTKTMLRKSKP